MCCALRPEVQHQKIKKFIALDKHGSRFKGKGNDILPYYLLFRSNISRMAVVFDRILNYICHFNKSKIW